METWERSSRRQPRKCGGKWTGSRERSRHGVLNFTHPFIYLEEINCCCQPTFGGGERIQEFPAYPLLVKESQVWVPQQDWVWSCKMHSSVCEQIFPILNRPCRAAHGAAFWALVSLVTGYLGDFFPASEKQLPRDLAERPVWGMLLAVGAFQPRMMAQTFSFSWSPGAFLSPSPPPLALFLKKKKERLLKATHNGALAVFH